MTDAPSPKGITLATVTGTAVASVREVDPFASYGAKVDTQGTYLTFKGNEYLYGQEGHSLPIGTRAVAFMPGLRVGWRKWWDSKVFEDRTELLVDMIPIEPREDLGDNDEGRWQLDLTGKPRDPWQMTNVLELAVDGERYIYATGSKGGIGAIGRLCKAYSNQRKLAPEGALPIIELGSDFYMHPVYAKTYVPLFPIVGWADPNTLEPVTPTPGQPKIAPLPLVAEAYDDPDYYDRGEQA